MDSQAQILGLPDILQSADRGRGLAQASDVNQPTFDVGQLMGVVRRDVIGLQSIAIANGYNDLMPPTSGFVVGPKELYRIWSMHITILGVVGGAINGARAKARVDSSTGGAFALQAYPQYTFAGVNDVCTLVWAPPGGMWMGPGTILGFDFYLSAGGPSSATGRLHCDRYRC